ncbi:MAG: transcriptional repressor [Phycisphaerae bacterium]|nr:transcriptional repressor [Phycisphaerae bacterium]
MDVHERIADEFQAAFTQDGFGRTEDRAKVLRAFLRHEDHVSADELHHELGDDAAISCEFVRQILDQFVHYGLAVPIRDENGLARYEHVHIGRHHDHIICVSCGRIVEVDCRLEDRVAELSKKTGFQAVHAHLQIHGICPDCVAARPARFSLAKVASGEKVRVVAIGGGTGMQRRLISMGLRMGSVVRRLNTNRFGPVVISIGGTRLALGRGMADRVIVEQVDSVGERA